MEEDKIINYKKEIEIYLKLIESLSPIVQKDLKEKIIKLENITDFQNFTQIENELTQIRKLINSELTKFNLKQGINSINMFEYEKLVPTKLELKIVNLGGELIDISNKVYTKI